MFVANQTGNVVFLAFALAGAHDFSVGFSIVSLASFVIGGLFGGWIGSRLGKHRGRLLSSAAAIQTVFIVVSVLISALSHNPLPLGLSYSLIITLAISMGIQNAAVRKLSVPDLTTTVLTLTIVGMAADSRVIGGSGSKLVRRLISVLAMFAGAFIGALMILFVSTVYPLVIALTLVAIVSAMARLLSRGNPSWTTAGTEAMKDK